MFLLDTMIPSDLRKGRLGNLGVRSWVASTPRESQFISVITVLELRRGALLQDRLDPPQGRVLHSWLEGLILNSFSGRILPIDQAVAERCAILQVPAARATLDVFIAATALVYDFTVVTRNVRHFDRTGVRLLNPFT